LDSGSKIAFPRGVANSTTTPATLTVGKASGSNTFAGVVGVVTNSNLGTQSNAINLVKTGASTQVFTNANTYTGFTRIEAGTLTLSGAGSLASSTITVGHVAGSTGVLNVSGVTGGFKLASGQRLEGEGTVTGSVTAMSGSTISPGVGTGQLTLSGALTLQSGATIEVAVHSGSAFDKLIVDGNVNLGSGTLVLMRAPAYQPAIGTTFTILQSSGSLSGVFNGLADLAQFQVDGVFWEIDYTSTAVNIKVVPEPAAVSLLGMASFLLRRRRARMPG
jgi:autotransporter-associated beta strand protein